MEKLECLRKICSDLITLGQHERFLGRLVLRIFFWDKSMWLLFFWEDWLYYEKSGKYRSYDQKERSEQPKIGCSYDLTVVLGDRQGLTSRCSNRNNVNRDRSSPIMESKV